MIDNTWINTSLFSLFSSDLGGKKVHPGSNRIFFKTFSIATFVSSERPIVLVNFKKSKSEFWEQSPQAFGPKLG